MVGGEGREREGGEGKVEKDRVGVFGVLLQGGEGRIWGVREILLTRGDKAEKPSF